MPNRRSYKRIIIDIHCLAYLETEEEVSGVLRDISESGIAVLFPPGTQLRVGSVFTFMSCDEYQYINGPRADVIMGKCRIIRVDSNENEVVAGCELITPESDLLEYVKNKKVVEFMKKRDTYLKEE